MSLLTITAIQGTAVWLTQGLKYSQKAQENVTVEGMQILAVRMGEVRGGEGEKGQRDYRWCLCPADSWFL